MTAPTGFTTIYGLKFPVPSDVYKAVIASKAIEKIDELLKKMYDIQTAPPVGAFRGYPRHRYRGRR